MSKAVQNYGLRSSLGYKLLKKIVWQKHGQYGIQALPTRKLIGQNFYRRRKFFKAPSFDPLVPPEDILVSL
jgi:hypothetical protein